MTETEKDRDVLARTLRGEARAESTADQVAFTWAICPMRRLSEITVNGVCSMHSLHLMSACYVCRRGFVTDPRRT